MDSLLAKFVEMGSVELTYRQETPSGSASLDDLDISIRNRYYPDFMKIATDLLSGRVAKVEREADYLDNVSVVEDMVLGIFAYTRDAVFRLKAEVDEPLHVELAINGCEIVGGKFSPDSSVYRKLKALQEDLIGGVNLETALRNVQSLSTNYEVSVSVYTTATVTANSEKEAKRLAEENAKQIFASLGAYDNATVYATEATEAE